MTDYVVCKKHLKPVGKGQWPDVIRHYVREPLPHITYTSNKDDAYIFDKEEADDMAYFVSAEVEASG